MRKSRTGIYANLIVAIESNRKYLVFVYNAFELMELKLVLSFLPGVALGHRYIKKPVLIYGF